MPAFQLIPSSDDLLLKNKYGYYSKKELGSQLINGHFTLKELGNIYNLKTYQIKHVFNSLGIVEVNPIGNTRVFSSEINPSLHQVLIGTLLGDAYMKTISYSVGHSIHQLDYIYHLAERLHPFVASFGDKDHSNTKSFSFWTFSHKVFIPYFERFYSHGKSKKFFLESTAPDIGPEGLAYWFMDDGKYGEYGFYLCVGDITHDEGSILIKMLKDNFGIESTFQNHNIEKGYHNIYITAESRARFLEIIIPYIIPSMRYKLEGTEYPKVEFSVTNIVGRHLKLCACAGRPIRYFGNKDVQRVISEKMNISDPKTIYKNKIIEDINNGGQVSKTFFRKVPFNEELKKLFECGMTDKLIAETYGFGRGRIASLRKCLNIPGKKSRVPAGRDTQLKRLFSIPGITMEKVMKEIHMSFYSLKTWMERNNINL